MAAPKAPKPSGKGAPPSSAAAAAVPANNTHKTEQGGNGKPMNFRVSEEFHTEFSVFAKMHRMSNKQLLQEAFEFYKQHKGG